MYQRGEFGKDANAINPWIASTFYAVDRAASFLKDWKAYYDNGDLIISDRYVTSNVIYQMGKLPRNQWESYLEWEYDLEHDKYGLPVPDVVIFLDVPLSVSQKMMSARYGGDESKKDIHESNLLFLKQCRATGWFAARRLGWKIVSCWEDNHLLSIDQIHERITRTVGQCEQVRELFI